MARRFTFWLRILLLVSPAAGLGVATGTASEIQSEPHFTDIARVVADNLPTAHVTGDLLDDSIAAQALENYLNVMDYDHSYFMAEDVDEFEAQVMELDDLLKDGHLGFAYKIFDRVKERASNRVDYVETLLANGFDFDVEESYQPKRKDLPWARGEEAWNDLWRKKIKNEYVARKVAATLKEEEQNETINPEETDEAEKTNESPEEKLTPEEMILKRHRQFFTVLDGHDSEWVLQAYLNAFAQAYDPHSAYLSPRATEDFDIAMKLSLTGIGAVLTYDEGAAKIVRLIAGGPADSDGELEAGDRIIAVAQADEDAVDIMFWPLYKSVRLIRGEKGTDVVLSVIPVSDPSGTTVRKVRLTRDKINLEERAAQSSIHELPGWKDGDRLHLGVVSLPDFYADQQGKKRGDPESRSCSQDVKRILDRFSDESVDGVLLDLRNNGGGSLQDAIEMTGFFIDRGPVVQVKANRRVQVLNDPDRDTIYDGPLVVLVNRMSASASEILAGALQDYSRAIVVGDEKTHGKGSVQSVFPIDRRDDKQGSLKVTTAAFYRIDGKSTQLHGVKPDIVLPSVMDVMEIGEEFLPNVLSWSRVAGTRHKQYALPENMLTDLNKRSKSRRVKNEGFMLYNDLVKRLGDRLAMQSVSLEYDTRLALARTDQELDDIRDQIGELVKKNEAMIVRLDDEAPKDKESSEDGEEKDDTSDLVLNEALFILRDLVETLGPAISGDETESAISAQI
jgi:carboxyl-terminal processing protease